MLRSLKNLEQYTVSATDGDIGKVVNFLFDDQRWTVRYLVADTSGFIDGRTVLISPISFREANWSTHKFHLALSREKVKNSPGIDVDMPVSRQHERDYYKYYEYPDYWGYAGLWGMGAYPGLLSSGKLEKEPAPNSDQTPGDSHLRSVEEVRGYHVQASDAAIGHIDDLVVDDQTWQVRYLVVDTRNWGFGKKVLVAPHWASRFSWEERKVHVDLTQQAIRSGPEWNATVATINREYETRLHDHLGRPGYWTGESRPQ